MLASAATTTAAMTTVVTDWSYIARACSAESPALIISSVKAWPPTTTTPTTTISSPIAAAARAARAIRIGDPARAHRRRDRRGAIARAADRGDPAGSVRVVAELVPQPPDVDVDRPVEDLGLVLAPDRVEQLVAAEDAAVGLEERLEQAELDVRQLDGPAVDRHLVAGRIEDEAVVADHAVAVPPRPAVAPGAAAPDGGAARPAEDRLDPDDELGRRERLRQVVVGAVLEAGDPVERSCRAPRGRGSASRRPRSSRRTARITARPSSSGSIRSRTTSAGRCRSIASSAAGPSAAVTTPNPSRSRYVRTRRTIFASSSTTRIGRSGGAGAASRASSPTYDPAMTGG